VTVPQPSLLLLRSLSDELVVRVLAAEPRLTRAEIATLIGLSKPTVAESVRRLESAGIVADTGERTTSRGGVGSYYALADGVGTALAMHVAAESVTAEVIDPYGSVLSRASAIVPRPATQAVVKRTLKAVASQALADRTGPVRAAVVSAADPVNRRTGSLVQLPDAPFLVGDLSPADALEGVVHGEVLVDNDGTGLHARSARHIPRARSTTLPTCSWARGSAAQSSVREWLFAGTPELPAKSLTFSRQHPTAARPFSRKSSQLYTFVRATPPRSTSALSSKLPRIARRFASRSREPSVECSVPSLRCPIPAAWWWGDRGARTA
jgi:DNA-binding Lrp family transcriptional regulator